MSFLFDENLSPSLVSLLKADYPGCLHVETIGMRGVTDVAIWDRARASDLAVVTKDDDFRSLALFRGSPPKVIWLRVGNAGTTAIADLLRAQRAAITAFVEQPAESLLVLSLAGR